MDITTWHDAIAAWTVALRAAGRPASTNATQTDHIRRLSRHGGVIGPWLVTTDDLIAWTGRQDWAIETRRGIRNSLKQFYAWGVACGFVDTSPVDGLPKVKAAQPKPRPAPEHSYRVALAAARGRERLMLRLAAEAGLRRAEIAQLHARDLSPDLAGYSLTVHGKGSRDRTIPLSESLARELLAWSKTETRGGWFFPGQDGGHLSPRWVGKLMCRLLPGPLTAHTLRHRFATQAYRATRDMMVCRDVLGHASVATTQRYIRIPDDAARDLMRRVGEL